MWTFEDGIAHCSTSRLTCRIDIGQPETGVVDMCWDGHRLPTLVLNAVRLFVPHDASRNTPLAMTGRVARRDALRVDYEDAAQHVMHLRVSRQIRELSEQGIWIDLQISVETQALHLEPRVELASRYPGRTETLPPEQFAHGANDNTGMVLPPDCGAWSWNVAGFQLADVPLVCAQIMDTTDTEDHIVTARDDQVEHRVRLFVAPLEKGVVRSVVIRTVLAPQQNWIASVRNAWLGLCQLFPLPQV